MSIKRSLLYVAPIVILMTAAGVSAQDSLDQTFTTADGETSVESPSGWVAAEQTSGKIIVNNDGVTIQFFDPGFVARVAAGVSPDDPGAVLVAFLDAGGWTHGDPATVRTRGRAGVHVTAAVETFAGDGLAYGLPIDDDSVAVAVAIWDADSAGALSTIDEIVLSYDSDVVAEPSDTVDSGAGGDLISGALSENATVADVDCTIRTNQAQYASVRVGPGLNRTAILFLPADRDFSVLGQAAANDGAMWWKLDKDEVSPNSAAEELWVNQDQVFPVDGCINVPEVQPPPVIPIPSDAVPLPGDWNVVPTTIRIACPGAAPGTFGSGSTPFVSSVTILSGGGAILLDFNQLQRTGPGAYFGQFPAAELGGTYALSITVTDTTRMIVEMDWRLDGCDYTLFMEMTKL